MMELYSQISFDIVKKYTKLMLYRRGYENIFYTDLDENNVPNKKPRLIASNFNDKKLIVFFIYKKTEKITIDVIKSIISVSKDITHIIIIHNTSFTTDAKQNTLNTSSFYIFETFTFDELSYDLFQILFKNPDDKENIMLMEKFPGCNKLPRILSSDPLARYLGIKHGDVVKGKFDGNDVIHIRICINAE